MAAAAPHSTQASDSAAPAAAAAQGRTEQRRTQRSAFQRTQIFEAIVELACEQGAESVSVGEIAARAGVSKHSFYELFANRQEAALGALEDAVARLGARVSSRYECERAWGPTREQAWSEKIRSGLRVLLELFDEEPRLARFCLLTSALGGAPALAYRAEVLHNLAALIDEGRSVARREPPPLTAESLIGGALTIIQGRLLEGSREPLLALLNPLMAAIAFAYLGNVQASCELNRPVPWRTSWRLSPQPQTQPPPRLRLTHRRLPVLLAIAKDPGLSNMQVAQAVGISDPGQISKLLSFLKQAGVIRSTSGGRIKGEPNAWTLTAAGQQLVRTLQSHGGSPEGLRYARNAAPRARIPLVS